MELIDIEIGKSYRHIEHPRYAYARAIAIWPPKTGKNTNRYSVVECEWTVNKNDIFGMIKYFRPSDLVEDAS